jgi:hypothetical protein
MAVTHLSSFDGELLLISPLTIACTTVDIVQNNAPTKRTSNKLASAAKGEVMNKSNPVTNRIVTSVLFMDAFLKGLWSSLSR